MGAGRYLFRAGALGALMAAVVALSAAVATAEELPDASCQLTSNTWTMVGYEPNEPGNNLTAAQTFTAVNSGRLTTAEVALTDVQFTDSENTGTLVMEIRSVDGTSGAPGTTVLASTSKLVSDIAGESTVSVDFSPGAGAEVVAGQQYALVLRSTDGTFIVKAFWDYDDASGPSCPGMHYGSSNGGAFLPDSNLDMIFSTFVTPPNVVSTNDSYSTAQGTPLRVAAPGLLSNDSVRNGAPITAAKVSRPEHGEVFVDADGSFAYFPDAGYLGTDSFTYRASDGSASGNTATVSIAVKDLAAPTVTGTKPVDRTRSVGPKANVKATFSEEMRSDSMIGAFKLFEKGSTDALAATVTYNAATRTITLNPDGNLERGTTYRARVAPTARDTAGNRLDQNPSLAGNQPKVWAFSVAS